MKVWGVYDDEIREIAEEVGLSIWNDRPWQDSRGRWRNSGIVRVASTMPVYRFRLGLGPKLEDGTRRFQKLSYRDRRTAFVCWHGHREFLFALYRRFPEARVQTALEDYSGRQDFIEHYATTYGRGNNFNLSRHWACVCRPEGAHPMRRRRPSQDATFEAFEQAAQRLVIQAPAIADIAATNMQAFNVALDNATGAWNVYVTPADPDTPPSEPQS